MNKIPDKYLNLLDEYIGFKTISTNIDYKQDIENCVAWLENILQVAGFKVKILKGKISNPIIYAEYIKDKNLRTILVYGHYDVQPGFYEDGWMSDPFKLHSADGRLYARGVIDNKGQFLVHLYTIMELIKNNDVRFNFKLLIEGNEETGNSELKGLLKDNIELLSSDLILISDGTISSNRPVIEQSLRGNMGGELTFMTANNSVHSGIYGNSIPNAIHELNKFISKIYGKNDRLNIPKFSTNDKLSAKNDRNSNKEIQRKLDLSKVFFSNTRNFHTKNGLDPAIIITGIKGGYIDEGISNIVPNKASAKINFRFPPETDPYEYLNAFKEFMHNNIPSYVKFNWNVFNIIKGVDISLSNELRQKIENILYSIYKRKVLYKHVGGSLPIITDFKELLGIPILSLPLANEDSNMHAKNENFDIRYLILALKLSQLLLTSDILEKDILK